MTKRLLLTSAALCAATPALSQTSVPNDTPEQAQADAANQNNVAAGEIVITAQKRVERRRDQKHRRSLISC